jgi:hypothetical protein
MPAPFVRGPCIVCDEETWALVAAPIENKKRPGTYVAPATRQSDGVMVALPMPADLALAWFIANPGSEL